jgi:hypothetical protein
VRVAVTVDAALDGDAARFFSALGAAIGAPSDPARALRPEGHRP